MDYFDYRNGELYCEEVAVEKLADKFGTPCFVYSKKTIATHYNRLAEAFQDSKPLICYSVKANSNLSIIKTLKKMGAGFDVVSGGELHRALAVGADAGTIVFAGVGKTDKEITDALQSGILMFNVESEAEFFTIGEIAGKLGKRARIALRCNPDVDPKTHKHITTGKSENKFGIDFEKAFELAQKSLETEALDLAGIHLHIGSQITAVEPYGESVAKGVAFAKRCRDAGVNIEYLNIGGGFGIFYHGGEAKQASEFAKVILPQIAEMNLKLIMEPGRFIIGNAGILLTTVTYRKETGAKTFLICDAGMNNLIRPSLYDAYHRIWPVKSPVEAKTYDFGVNAEKLELEKVDVVGPICESGDFFGKHRDMLPVKRGDRLAVFSAGAYGMSMASNYNSQPRAAEVLVDGSVMHQIRTLDTYEDIIRNEIVI